MPSDRIIISTAIGLLLTCGLLGFSYVADNAGYGSLARTLNWQNTLLQSFVPGHTVGTAERALMQGTPMNTLAFFVSVPLGWLVHSKIVYFLLGRFGTVKR